MAKYLVQVNYTLEGVRGLVKDGGTARRATIERVIAGMGGTMESFYFCFGKYDVVVIADLPDDASIAAISLTVGASGAAEVQTTTLLTAEQIDDATRRSVGYVAPGAGGDGTNGRRAATASSGRAAAASGGKSSGVSGGKSSSASARKSAGTSSGKSRGGRGKGS